jgi:hypothetical protein
MQILNTILVLAQAATFAGKTCKMLVENVQNRAPKRMWLAIFQVAMFY